MEERFSSMRSASSSLDTQPKLLRLLRKRSGAERVLTTYAWPGNVRELRNVIERTLAFEPLPPVIAAGDLRLGS
jgi:transcriptional regulator of acetoin/glycerol metabolism